MFSKILYCDSNGFFRPPTNFVVLSVRIQSKIARYRGHFVGRLAPGTQSYPDRVLQRGEGEDRPLYPPSMRKIVYLCLVASASAFSTGPLLNSAMPRLRHASAVTSLRARDCIFDQEPCESSGECRVNNAFCDDNHGFHQPGPRQPCARKAAPKISEKVLKIFDEVAAEQQAQTK